MSSRVILGLIVAAVALTRAGCPAAGDLGTLRGTISADWCDITTDVTITQGDQSWSIPVVVVGTTYQVGAFTIANVPTGSYSVVATFEADYPSIAGNTYRVDDGSATPVDDTGSSGTFSPYAYTITIDELQVLDETTLDRSLYGNVG